MSAFGTTTGSFTKAEATELLGAAYKRRAHTADATAGKVAHVLDLDSTLETIGDLLSERAQLDYEVEATIGAALTAGASWAQIAAALGVSKQGAAQKYRDARRTYARQPDTERARLDRQAGVARRPIMFEVRSLVKADVEDGDSLVSRHKTAPKAWGEAAKATRATGMLHTVYKVWPSGRAVLLVQKGDGPSVLEALGMD